MKMDKIRHPVVIKYLQKKRLAPIDLRADNFATLEDEAPASTTVQKGVAEFTR